MKKQYSVPKKRFVTSCNDSPVTRFATLRNTAMAHILSSTLTYYCFNDGLITPNNFQFIKSFSRTFFLRHFSLLNTPLSNGQPRPAVSLMELHISQKKVFVCYEYSTKCFMFIIKKATFHLPLAKRCEKRIDDYRLKKYFCI